MGMFIKFFVRRGFSVLQGEITKERLIGLNKWRLYQVSKWICLRASNSGEDICN